MTDPIIEVQDLTKTFGAFTAVNRVSFEVGRGEIFGYLGANGAGKSTTIRMLCGLLPPTSGRASVAGCDIARNPQGVKRSIGYMSQRFSLYLDLTVGENLEFFAGAYGIGGRMRRERIGQALAGFGLEGREETLTGALPGGIQQRLALACALLHEPGIVFLDEPTAGVDPSSRRDFWKTIRLLARRGTTVFVTTHHLDEAEYCHRVGLMVDGRLVALDTPDELKRRYVPGAMYAVDVRGGNLELRERLRREPGVTQVQPFGSRLHVLTEGPLAEVGSFRANLAGLGFSEAVVEKIKPSLEDVFLKLVGKGEEEPAGTPALPEAEGQ